MQEYLTKASIRKQMAELRQQNAAIVAAIKIRDAAREHSRLNGGNSTHVTGAQKDAAEGEKNGS